uniref:FBD domain-containing protein n=1 Tax=Brassica oleracea var. oleracea TaxID=109376 RepID=A0A0D3ACF1_BRAOL
MDRVSNLPDEVLCHILSFLTTKEAALTSILAKSALARGVSDLDLAIILDYDEDEDEDDNYYQLSPKCFECSTLVSLRIDCGSNIALAADRVSLPLLKTLVLDSVPVCPIEFETLLRALPSLEELQLVEVMWKDMYVNVTVKSASVKTLTIKLNDCLSALSFDTPSLLHLVYYGFVASDFPVVNMEKLFDARIIFCLSEDQLKRLRDPDHAWFDEEDALGYSNVWKLFHGIRNVPNLDLLPDTLESDKDRGWQAMPALLRNCPHLEILAIEGLVHHVTDECGDACDCVSREGKGLSLTVCQVKELEIQGFRGTMKEMAMIKHFLDYFPCLKEMEVYVEENDPTQLGNREISKLVQEILELYSKLSGCNVQLLVSDYLEQKWLKNKKIS